MSSALVRMLSLLLVSFAFFACEPEPSQSAGVSTPCPKRPNCISSLSKNSSSYVAPLSYQGSDSEAYARLLGIVESLEHSQLLVQDFPQIHVVCSSAVFGFKDDLHFKVNTRLKQIEIRSASRLGYYDFDVNRERLEQIRVRFLSSNPAVESEKQ